MDARGGFLVAVLVTLVAGCPDSTVPPPPNPNDDGGFEDGSIDPTLDSDMDGLCDVTEIARGTDPSRSDTDGDGFSDRIEIQLGFDALLPASPNREIIHTMRENPEATLQVEIVQEVRGEGEEFTGAFEGLPVTDLAMLTAADFYVGSEALYADPIENVGAVDESAETFRGVVGRTRLAWEVRFAFGSGLVRDCVRAYPFRYNVKRSDGTFLSAQRHYLVILPIGDTLATAEWCVAPGSGCF